MLGDKIWPTNRASFVGGSASLHMTHWMRQPWTASTIIMCAFWSVSFLMLICNKNATHLHSREDTVAGLARFLVGKFPVVVNKILPEASPADIQKILEDDPDYFNDLTYDEVVGPGCI